MSYLHCNRCYILPKNEEITFYLMSCRDVLCKNCVISCQPNICAFCYKPAQPAQINDEMIENIFLKDTCKMLREIMDIEMFQSYQKMSFLAVGEHIRPKYEQKMKENEELRKMIQEKEGALKNELGLIKELRVQIKNEEQNPDANCSSSLLNISSNSRASSSNSLSFMSKSFEESVKELLGEGPFHQSNQPTSKIPVRDNLSIFSQNDSGRETTGCQQKPSKPPMVQGPFHQSNAATFKSNIPVRKNESVFSQSFSAIEPTGNKQKSAKAPMVQGPFHRANETI